MAFEVRWEYGPEDQREALAAFTSAAFEALDTGASFGLLSEELRRLAAIVEQRKTLMEAEFRRAYTAARNAFGISDADGPGIINLAIPKRCNTCDGRTTPTVPSAKPRPGRT